MTTNETPLAIDVSQDVAQPLVAQHPLRHFYELTKPGITQMVALTGLAGFYLAIPTDLMTYAASPEHWILFLCAMMGIVFLSSGSSVINHVLERDHDRKMKRTAMRPLPSGAISMPVAVTFGIVLTLAGILLLWNVNELTCLLGVITWMTYVVVYTPLKRKTTLALLIGGIPGALPFAGGWTAVTGTMDLMAWVLFAILFLWQLPHFLALSWMYRTDYAEGGFVMSAISDTTGATVGWQTVVSSVLTMVAALLPTVLGAAGWLYGAGALALGVWLTVESLRMYRLRDHRSARRVLLTSYAVLMGLVMLLLVDKAQPVAATVLLP